MKVTFLTIFLLVLVSCMNKNTLEQVQDLKNQGYYGQVFNGFLATHYMEFAKKEYEKNDFTSYKTFSEKALNAAKGVDVYPEDPEMSQVDEIYKPELIYARRKLMDLLLDKELIDTQAGLSANAQFNYDCWLEERVENWQENEINDCKYNFYEAIKKLEKIKKYKIFEEQVYTKAKQEVLEQQKKLFNKEYIVFFDIGKKEVNAASEEVLALLTDEIRALNTESYKITIKAYTDASGSKKTNEKLSLARANNLKDFLEKEKIVGKGIVSEFYLDEVKSKLPKNGEFVNNRKAEIIIQELLDENKYPILDLENSLDTNHGDIIKHSPVNLYQ